MLNGDEAAGAQQPPRHPLHDPDGVQAVMAANAVLHRNLLREMPPSHEGGKRRLAVGRTFIPLGALLEVTQVLNAVIARMRQDGALPPEPAAAPPT